MYNFKHKKGNLLLTFALLLLTTFVIGSANASAELTIRYFNLEVIEAVDLGYAGDSILITTPQGKHILVDSGTPEAGPQVYERLVELGIDHLDYVVATHPHQDHIGGFRTVLDKVSVGQLYQINLEYSSSHYRALQNLIKQHDIDHAYVEEGLIVEIEPGVELEFFNPPAGTQLGLDHGLSTGGVNDLSTVFRLTYDDFSYLVTGDIYRAREEQLAEKYGERLQSRVYDAPHHGQHTSSSRAFINEVNPEISVFSIQYLASFSTYQDLRDLGSQVYVTGLNGEVVVRTDGQEIEVEVEQEINSPFLQ